jgi:hypothetical protein
MVADLKIAIDVLIKQGNTLTQSKASLESKLDKTSDLIYGINDGLIALTHSAETYKDTLHKAGDDDAREKAEIVQKLLGIEISQADLKDGLNMLSDFVATQAQSTESDRTKEQWIALDDEMKTQKDAFSNFKRATRAGLGFLDFSEKLLDYIKELVPRGNKGFKAFYEKFSPSVRIIELVAEKIMELLPNHEQRPFARSPTVTPLETDEQQTPREQPTETSSTRRNPSWTSLGLPSVFTRTRSQPDVTQASEYLDPVTVSQSASSNQPDAQPARPRIPSMQSGSSLSPRPPFLRTSTNSPNRGAVHPSESFGSQSTPYRETFALPRTPDFSLETPLATHVRQNSGASLELESRLQERRRITEQSLDLYS